MVSHHKEADAVQQVSKVNTQSDRMWQGEHIIIRVSQAGEELIWEYSCLPIMGLDVTSYDVIRRSHVDHHLNRLYDPGAVPGRGDHDVMRRQ